MSNNTTPIETATISATEREAIIAASKRQSAMRWGLVIVALLLLLAVAIAYAWRLQGHLGTALSQAANAGLDCRTFCPACLPQETTGTTILDGSQDPTETMAALKRSLERIPGKNIVLVVDDTGSMGNKREELNKIYQLAATASGKIVLRSFLFTDDRVLSFDPGKEIYERYGRKENTCGALIEAAKYPHADGIVLITDEIGDDWDRCGDFSKLPPVVANCIIEYDEHGKVALRVDPSQRPCTETLRTLATGTHGGYVEHRLVVSDAQLNVQQAFSAFNAVYQQDYVDPASAPTPTQSHRPQHKKKKH